MNNKDNMPYDVISENALQPVLELLKGGDPDTIAKKAGITKEKLFQMRDELLAKAKRREQQAEAGEIPLAKVGRNDPCPCGSGKKYKRCCMEKHEQARRNAPHEQLDDSEQRHREQERLVDRIEKAFGLYAAGKNEKAIESASKLLKKYPNEDRLHDIIATSRQAAGDFDEAVEICMNRLEVAEEEKAYFVSHGRYRDAEVDKPALSYYYPPMTWLQKYWIALKARDYHLLKPKTENKKIDSLIKDLKTSDDPNRFPEKHAQGMELRKKALEETLEKLQTSGEEVVAHLLPLACRYSWAGLFVPEILSHYKTELAVRGLMDISMFGFAYASGASLHYLEGLGEVVIASIEKAFSQDKQFDPIKTGLVSVLGNVRTDAAYDLLIRLLENESHHVVNWAGDALGKFERTEALPSMMAAASRIGGEKMIDEAIQKLQDLA
jgi:tetratricopeptide (TPR) repeat protein